MKKSKKVMVSLLAALMVGGSLSVPAFAAEAPAQNVSLEAVQNQEAKIVSQKTVELPLTASNMTQHEQTITEYSDGVTVTDTLTVYDIPTLARSATQRKTANHQKTITRSGSFVATLYLTGTFEFNKDAKTVRTVSSSKGHGIKESYSLIRFNEYYQSGGAGLWWAPWSNVKADYVISLNGGAGFFTSRGSLEIKCDSNGNIEKK